MTRVGEEGDNKEKKGKVQTKDGRLMGTDYVGDWLWESGDRVGVSNGVKGGTTVTEQQ